MLIHAKSVRTAIQNLIEQRIHPSFAAYLALKWLLSNTGQTFVASPKWGTFFDTFFKVAGRHNRPYFRPFWDEISPVTSDHLWLNRNLAGSFSPSSLRPDAPLRRVVMIDDRNYSLRENHWELALKHLLYGERVSALALACFLFRDYIIFDQEPKPNSLIKLLQQEFGFSEREFETLFSKRIDFSPIFVDADWNEPWNGVVPGRSPRPARNLSANDLGLPSLSEYDGGNSEQDTNIEVKEDYEQWESGVGIPDLPDDDPRLIEVKELMKWFGGVIFVGPPGTSKSWYAERIAMKLTNGDRDCVYAIQFHQSYQYEDFVEGYVLTDSGPVLKEKHLVRMCEAAMKNPHKQFVMIIDEINRADPSRVFGEALTYVEKSKRGKRFFLASQREFCIPPNVFFIGTMNPLDYGTNEVDIAFERRFARMEFQPDVDLLRNYLRQEQVNENVVVEVVGLFEFLQRRLRHDPHAQIGHTFFFGVRSAEDLLRVWNYQLKFILQRAFRYETDTYREIEKRWQEAIERIRKA